MFPIPETFLGTGSVDRYALFHGRSWLMNALVLALVDRFSARTYAAAYCLATAIAFALWWILLLAVPESRPWFFPSSMTSEPLMAFAIADTLVASALAFAAFRLLRRRTVAILLWCIAGGLLYATLYCIALSWMTDEAWMGTAAMSTCTAMLLAFCTVVGRDEPLGFRESAPQSRFSLVARTLAQIVVFWSVCLMLVPLGIREFEQRLGLASFDLPDGFGWTMFGLASLLGLSSAWAMVTHGRGTPLPSDCAPELVRSGVYRFVRNPMATAGIVQGIASGLIFGSYGVVVISFLGGAFWHFVIRPVEERDMEARFGQPYLEYKGSVRLWIPGRNPRSLSG